MEKYQKQKVCSYRDLRYKTEEDWVLKKHRNEGRNIVYMDESYILSSHTPKKSWSDDSSEGLLAPVSRTERLIIIHAGGESGFVPGALLMWKANQASGDYHHQMNKDNYEKWVKENLIQ